MIFHSKSHKTSFEHAVQAQKLSHQHAQKFATGLLLSLTTLLTPAQTIGVDFDGATQSNLNNLKKYYEQVVQRLNNAESQTAQPKGARQTRTSIAPIEARSQYAAPISRNRRSNVAAYTLDGRDPFAVTPAMVDNENHAFRPEIALIPTEEDFRVPNMSLKGVITGSLETKNLSALLEIDGLGVFVVREGDTVGLHGIGNGRDVIQIESISRLSLVVRTGSYGGDTDKRYVIR